MKTTLVAACSMLLLSACGSASTSATSPSTSMGIASSTGSSPASSPVRASAVGAPAADAGATPSVSAVEVFTGTTFTESELSAVLARTPRSTGGTMTPVSTTEIAQAQRAASSAAAAPAPRVQPPACAAAVPTGLGAVTADKLTGESMSVSTDASLTSMSSFRTPEQARASAAVLAQMAALCATQTLTGKQGPVTVTSTVRSLNVAGAHDAVLTAQATTAGLSSVPTISARAYVGPVLVQVVRTRDANADAATKDLTNAVTTLVAASH